MTPSQRRCVPPPLIAVARPIELRAHGDFVEWLAASGGSLAVTTYNSGKLAFFSAANGVIAASFWHFPRPMGLALSADRLALGSRDHIWNFRIASGQLGVDAVYWTGRLDAHDLAFDRRGLMFANTRFNCIARPSDRVHFLRTWQPRFMAATSRRDCCHLNGIGLRGGRLTMATAFCESDAPSAWREGERYKSGVLIDVRGGQIAARGLCLPHSPRWHAGRWWLCNSGEGTLCSMDRAVAAEPFASLPGFTRGLAFAEGRAIVGLSRIRKRHILDAPPVRERFARLRSGVWLVNSKTGRQTGALEFIRGGREVYDVVFLPGIDRPEFAWQKD